MRVRPGPEFVQAIKRGRHVRRMLVPVGDFDGAEDDIPAPPGVAELAPQPAGPQGSAAVWYMASK
jgi:hypothetical protein